MKWFESWFDTPYYHILYKNRDFVEAENFITKLITELDLPKGSKIIDLACGKGRHSVFLNKLGYDVLGVDLSKESIAHNRQFENNTLHFGVHDMREPMNYGKVDAVFNLFTSFGYFEDDKDDEKVFESVSGSLAPNGFFVIDFLNKDFVNASVQPHQKVERDGIVFDIHKKIENETIIKDIEFKDQGKDFYFQEKVKLHSKEKLISLGEKYGFTVEKIWGDYQLNPLSPTSSRCIILFKKG